MAHPPCKLVIPKDDYVQVSICLNRVGLIGLAVDEAMSKLAELGYNPELRYQWNPDYSEIDVFAVIHEKLLDESEMTKEKCDQLWNVFGNETILYAIGSEADQGEDWIARFDLEREVLPPSKTTKSTEVAA